MWRFNLSTILILIAIQIPIESSARCQDSVRIKNRKVHFNSLSLYYQFTGMSTYRYNYQFPSTTAYQDFYPASTIGLPQELAYSFCKKNQGYFKGEIYYYKFDVRNSIIKELNIGLSHFGVVAERKFAGICIKKGIFLDNLRSLSLEIGLGLNFTGEDIWLAASQWHRISGYASYYQTVLSWSAQKSISIKNGLDIQLQLFGRKFFKELTKDERKGYSPYPYYNGFIAGLGFGITYSFERIFKTTN